MNSSNISNNNLKSVTKNDNKQHKELQMAKSIDIAKLREQFIKADANTLVTTEEATAYTGLSISRFNTKAVEGGGIAFRKIGKRRMYLKQDILDWIEEHCPKVSNTIQYTY